MKKKQSSRKSSSSTKKVIFNFKPNTTIYEKTTTGNGIKNTIKLEIRPTSPNEPTIESKTTIRNNK